MDNKLSELKAVAEKYRSTFAEHRKKPRDYDALDAWDKATSEFVESVNNDELNIISYLLDKMESEEGYRKGAFLACSRWHDKFREAEAKQEAAEQRIAEMDADLADRNGVILEQSKRIAELERANKSQDDHINQQQDRIDSLEKKNAGLGRGLVAAEKRLATPVRLPELCVYEVNSTRFYDRLSEAEVISVLREQGYTVEGDEQ